MSIYFDKTDLDVADGETALGSDLNNLLNETDAGFEQVAQDVTDLSGKAITWGNEDPYVQVEPGKYSSKHFAQIAEDWAVGTPTDNTGAVTGDLSAKEHAENAATSAGLASDSEGAAAGSASAAAGSASAASDSEDAAGLSEIAAGLSADKAEEYAISPDLIDGTDRSAKYWAEQTQSASAITDLDGTTDEIDVDLTDPKSPVLSIAAGFDVGAGELTGVGGITVTPSASGRLIDYEIELDQTNSDNLIINSDLMLDSREMGSFTPLVYPNAGWDCWRSAGGSLTLNVSPGYTIISSMTENTGTAQDVGITQSNGLLEAAIGKEVTMSIKVEVGGSVPTYMKSGGSVVKLLDTVGTHSITFTMTAGSVSLVSELGISQSVGSHGFRFSEFRVKYGSAAGIYTTPDPQTESTKAKGYLLRLTNRTGATKLLGVVPRSTGDGSTSTYAFTIPAGTDMRTPISGDSSNLLLVNSSGANYVGTLVSVESNGGFITAYISMTEGIGTSPSITTLKLSTSGYLEFSGE